MSTKIVFTVILGGIILIGGGFFVLYRQIPKAPERSIAKQELPQISQSIPTPTPTPKSVLEPTPTPAPAAGKQIQYLLFQEFTGGNDGTGIFRQAAKNQAQLKNLFGDYVGNIQNKLQADTLSAAANRKYGFSIGPLTLDQSDQELSDTMKTAFDVAIEKNVAVAFHFDITHFWKNAKNPDGTRLSDQRGDRDNREWKDWDGTIADKNEWDNEPGIMPSMCFECKEVKALVDHVAGSVIAPAVKAGIDRLNSSGKKELFAGVIIGWEAGSLNSLGYHSLKLKGYNSATSLIDLRKAQNQILHDYLERWAKVLVNNGISREKLYTHTTNFTQSSIDHTFSEAKKQLGEKGFADFLLKNIGAGPDSFWIPFNDYSNAGFSVYINSQERLFEAIHAEAAKHNGSWAEAEGTNTTIEGNPSEINWETYLGKIFNHGGTLANIFGGFLGAGSGGYGKATESAEAVAAYKKFLRGEKLVETEPAASASSAQSTSSSGGLAAKIEKIQKEASAWIQKNPSRQSEFQSLMQKLDDYLKTDNTAEAERTAEIILNSYLSSP